MHVETRQCAYVENEAVCICGNEADMCISKRGRFVRVKTSEVCLCGNEPGVCICGNEASVCM